ncbi:MAG: hypothetical protein WAK91_14450 [Candidatus Acidiferrales bacterium]|jgi:hypothetical protein
MSATPVPPAAPRQNNVAMWWILGIVAGGIALLVIGALVVVSLVIHKVHISQSADRVEIETPVGAIKVNQDEAHSTGLPVYPGATAQKSQGANFEISSNDTRAGLAIEKYHSSDSRDDVKTWYAKHLGSSYRMETPETNHDNKIDGVQTDLSPGDIAFVDDHGSGARVVAVKASGDGTDIVLIRVGKKEPQ